MGIFIIVWLISGFLAWVFVRNYQSRHGIKITDEDKEMLPKIVFAGFISVYFAIKAYPQNIKI